MSGNASTPLFDLMIGLVQKSDRAGLEALFSSESPAVVQSVINKGLSQEWFKYGPTGETALHIACRRNDVETARVLISHGASISVLNSVKRSPLEVCSPQNALVIRAFAEGKTSSPGSPPNMAAGLTNGMSAMSLSDSPPSAAKPADHVPCSSGDGGTQIVQPLPSSGISASGQMMPQPAGNAGMMQPQMGMGMMPGMGMQMNMGMMPGMGMMKNPTPGQMMPNQMQNPTLCQTMPNPVKSDTVAEYTGVVPKARKAEILRGLKDFGVSLFFDGSDADAADAGAPQDGGKGHSRFKEMPKTLVDVLTIIDSKIKNERASYATVIKALESCDSSAATEEEFTHLVELINGQNKILDAYDSISMQALIDTIVMYFEMLPGPVVPVKYFSTILYVANVQSSRGVMAQARILFNYLPTISRILIGQFGCFFQNVFSSTLEPTPVLDMISARFFKYFFRATDALDPKFTPSSSQHAFLLEELYANAFLRNISYITLQMDQADITSIRHADDKQVTVGDVVLFAVTLYEFTNPNSTKNSLTFAKGERVRLVNLHKNDWLEGMLNKKRGFLPKSYVKLILHNNPPSRLKTVPGMPSAPSPAPAAGAAPAATPGAPAGAAAPAMNPAAGLGAGGAAMNPMMMMMMQPGGQQAVRPGGDQAGAGANGMMNPGAAGQGMMMGMNPMGQQPGMMYGPNVMNPMLMMSGNPLLMPGGQNGDVLYQQRMEQLRLAQEQLVQQQMQMQMQLQMQQVKLARREQELEAKAQLDSLKKDTLNWQINYDELQLEQKIGEGGFGEVYRAKWRGTVVAVKALKHKGPSSQFTADEAERYKREVSILRALNHPNLVLFLGACLTPRLCMISEFMFGGSLYDLLYKKKKIPDHTKRCTLALDIAKAMAFLHNHKPPIVHRDLKSLNILLDEKGEHAKVGDVGLAVGINKGELKGAVGTYSWMPPEMMKGQTYTEKADVYSYGLVLYEMCTGKLPFAGLPPQQISLRVAVYNERPPLPSSLNSKWRDLITSCWNGEDVKRPSFIAILDVLTAIEKK